MTRRCDGCGAMTKRLDIRDNGLVICSDCRLTQPAYSYEIHDLVLGTTESKEN